MALVTTSGKKAALLALKMRRKENSKKEQISNSSLPAGSPMYFYYISCNDLADTKPESYVVPPKQLCEECQALKDLGWLE